MFKKFLGLVAVLISVLALPMNAQRTGTITIDREDLTLAIGESYTFTVKQNGSVVQNSTMTWQCWDETVCTVDQNGKVTAIGSGTATILVQPKSGGGFGGGGYAMCVVTVPTEPIADDQLPFVTTKISKGEFAPGTKWYLMSIRGGKYINASKSGVLCNSAKPQGLDYLWCFVGTSKDGIKIYNYQEGTPYVLATNEIYDNAQACMSLASQTNDALCTYSFWPNKNGGFSISVFGDQEVCFNDYGGSGKLAYWISQSALHDDGSNIVFEEVDPADYGGTSSGDVVSCTGVTLNQTSLSLGTGDVVTLTAKVSPADATYKTVIWSSSAPGVASVKDGQVTGVSAGKATITATTHNGLTATCAVTVTQNDNVTGLCINEIMSANVDQYMDPSYNYGGWIELYNPGSRAINLATLYITDDPAEPKKWDLASLAKTYANYSTKYSYPPHESSVASVPARGFRKVWFDHSDWRYPMMVPFKLDCDGGTIYITDGKSVTVQADYPEAIPRTSWARMTDGGDTWGYTSNPTPGSTNALSMFAEERVAAPVPSIESRVFTSGTINFSVAVPDGATLYYTTDGSTPTEYRGEHGGAPNFSINTTTIFRFVAIQDGKLASPVVTRSFIKSEYDLTIPVMSLVTEEGNMYDSEYGIFTRGSNGRPGLGQSSPCNWNQDWDRPANVEYFTADGKNVFNQEANINNAGGWSRAYEPHSFKIKGKKQYEGMNYLPYAFFPNKPYMKNKTLHMRNGGNDNPGNGGTGRFKDGAIQEVILQSGLNIDGQTFIPVQLYRNGEYAGLINLREPNNYDHVYANYGYADDEVDQFEMNCDSAYVQTRGTKEAFDRLYALSEDPGSYEDVKKILDVEEFCNYFAIESYLCLGDYGYNNVKGFRPRTEDGRFRMVLFDLDSASSGGNGFSSIAGQGGKGSSRSFNGLYEGPNGSSTSSIRQEIEYITIWRNLMQNSAEFRKQFVDQTSIVVGSVFDPTYAAGVIDKLLDNVREAASHESSLTGKSLNPASVASSLKNSYFCSNRQSDVMNNLANFSFVSDAVRNTSNQNLNLSQNNSRGRLFLNDHPIPTGAMNGRIFAPVTLRAEAPAGYKFIGWKGEGGVTPPQKGEQLFDMESEWMFYDQGSLDDTGWNGLGYSTYEWSNGYAPFGYDSKGSYFATPLDYGSDSGNKRPTYYFRKNVNVPQTPSSVSFTYRCDDGFVVYVNGEYAGRYNMNSTNPKYSDYTPTYVSQLYDEGTITLDASLFKKGGNTIAVEVHNCNAGSSDLYWDASLEYVPTGGEVTPSTEDIVSTDPEYTLPTNGNITLQAVYGKLSDEELAQTDGHPVKINEVSAANSVFVNDYFKKDDWVELYNTTDQDIDLEGYYLSDNVSKPTKWQVTKTAGVNTIIPAHGFKVIWCSKREPISQLHANFKLDNTEGSCIVLTAPDQTWADTLYYKVMNGDETCGLFPDGSSNVYLLNKPTIEQSNRMNMYCDFYNENDIKPVTPTGVTKLVSQSNELGINALNDALVVTNEDFTPTTVCVYTMDGRLVKKEVLDMTQGHNALNISGLMSGAYVGKASCGDVTVSVKFNKK